VAQLIVRNLEEEIVRALKLRAARSGRSAEEEHREILRRALGPGSSRSLKGALGEMPDVGDDADFARSDDLGREVEL
jgi:antitoxin FitA